MFASPWGSLLTVFWQPEAVFHRLRERWVWFPAYGAGVVVGLFTVTLFRDSLLTVMMQIVAQQMLQAGASSAPPAFMRALLTAALYGSVFLGPLMIGLPLALLGRLLGALAGGGVRFGQWFSIVIWALVPATLLGGVLRTILTAAGAVNAKGQVHLGPAALVAPDSPLYPWLAAVDIFNVWTAVLVAIGFAAFTGARANRAALVGLFFFVIPAAIGALITRLSGAGM